MTLTKTAKHPCPKCEQEMEFERADPDYGSDADGNRGVPMPATYVCANSECELYGESFKADSRTEED